MFTYLPGSHGRQTAPPGLSRNLPIGHTSHWSAPLSPLKVEIAQGVHSVLPVALANFPGAQLVQTERPSLLLKVPLAHGSQPVVPDQQRGELRQMQGRNARKNTHTQHTKLSLQSK